MTYRNAPLEFFSSFLIFVIVASWKFLLISTPFLISPRAFHTRSFHEQHFKPKWPEPYFLWAYSSPLINPGTPIELRPKLADLGFWMYLIQYTEQEINTYRVFKQQAEDLGEPYFWTQCKYESFLRSYSNDKYFFYDR